eukprot:426919_1
MSSKRRLQLVPVTPYPSIKKRKLNQTSHNIPYSKFLFHIEDQIQFQLIYKALLESNVIKKYQVAAVSLEIISEYATGSIKQCDNYIECENEILILKAHANIKTDYAIFKPPLSNIKTDYNNDLNKGYQIFCYQCNIKTKLCKFTKPYRMDVGGSLVNFCSKLFVPSQCICGVTFNNCDRHRRYCLVCIKAYCSYECHTVFKCCVCRREVCNSTCSKIGYNVYCKFCQ